MHKDELGRLFRFAVTGAGLAVLYVVSYVALVRAGLPLFAANLCAFVTCVIIQYVVQTFWTFQRPVRDAAQGVRFALTVGFGLIYSSLISSAFAPYFAWPPWVAACVVAVTLPVFNYLSFRFWVYQPENNL